VSGFLAAMCMPASSSTQMDACACFTVSGNLPWAPGAHSGPVGARISCGITLHGCCTATCMQACICIAGALHLRESIAPRLAASLHIQVIRCIMHASARLPQNAAPARGALSLIPSCAYVVRSSSVCSNFTLAAACLK
jgi:hypothetical protein